LCDEPSPLSHTRMATLAFQGPSPLLDPLPLPLDPPLLVARNGSVSGGTLVAGAAGSAGDRTGLMLWPGSTAMCRFVHAAATTSSTSSSSSSSPATRRWPAHVRAVVELGCGCGAVSALAARYLAPPTTSATLSLLRPLVIATDGSDSALTLARQTLDANGATFPRVQTAVRRLGWEAGSSCSLEGLLRGRAEDGDEDEGKDALRDDTAAAAADYPTSASAVLAAEVVYPSSTFRTLLDLFGVARGLLGRGEKGPGGGTQSPPSPASPQLPRTDAASYLIPNSRGGPFVMSYVQRRPETTLSLLLAADVCGWAWDPVSPSLYTEPGEGADPMGACVVVFTMVAGVDPHGEEERASLLGFPAGLGVDAADEAAVVAAALARIEAEPTFAAAVTSAFPHVLAQVEAARLAREEAAAEEWAAPGEV
jgi:hypothetical protein